jgi:hypothetical protein
MRRPVLVIMGMLGRAPFAGVAWQVLHYLEGFRRLGYDVHYVEDTGDWAYDPVENTIASHAGYTVGYIGRLMRQHGLADRWAYRAAAEDGRLYGLSEGELARVFERAEVLVNLTGATLLGERHLRVPARVYLETDPVLPEIEVARGHRFTIELLEAHTHHFTFGENLGAPDCAVPTGRFAYKPTRQPVVLDWWTPRPDVPAAGAVTTVASWKQSGKDVEWNGETYYWSKHLEFVKVLDLPGRLGIPMELALACDDVEAIALLRGHGWRVIDGLALSLDVAPYREYILRSRAEFTVAKDQNIRLRSGWFSDRSACYLAAGRPVVTQDTAFGNALPTGEGLFAFLSTDDAVAALEAIASDYARHSRAAREIAEQCFKAETVLSRLLAEVGV